DQGALEGHPGCPDPRFSLEQGVDGVSVAGLDAVQLAVELGGARHEEDRHVGIRGGLAAAALSLDICTAVHAAEGSPLPSGLKRHHEVRQAGGRGGSCQPPRGDDERPRGGGPTGPLVIREAGGGTRRRARGPTGGWEGSQPPPTPRTPRPATPQRPAGRRRVAPTPIMEPVMVCVVLTGMPPTAVPISMSAPAVSAQKPPTGRSWVIRIPIVFTIRQPPAMVPRPIAV